MRLFAPVNVNGVQAPGGGEGRAARERLIAGVMAKGRDVRPAEQPSGTAVIDMYSPIIDLKRAKGLFGRLIYRIADRWCTRKKDKTLLTFRYMSVRSAMQYAGFNLARTHGFIDICNGSFFKGLKKLVTGKEGKR